MSCEHISNLMEGHFDRYPDWKEKWKSLAFGHPYACFLELSWLSRHLGIVTDEKKKTVNLFGNQGNATQWGRRDKDRLELFGINNARDKQGFEKLRRALVENALSADEKELEYLRSLAVPPSGSTLRGWEFLLSLEVRLDSMLLSRDDRRFSPMENSFSREWAFHVPIFKASGISGLFRNALETHLEDDAIRQRVAVLMGPGPDKVEDNPRAGRLRFYPMIFDRTTIDVFTPLDPARRYADKGPVDMEGVPKGLESRLCIGYFPLSSELEAGETVSDLGLVCEGVLLLIRDLGLGAKRSSDFGNLSLCGSRELFLSQWFQPHIEAVKQACASISLKSIYIFPE